MSDFQSMPSTPLPSTALLALNRFVRGPLKQMGIGVASLMLMLGLSVQMPAESATAAGDVIAYPTSLHAMPSVQKSAAVRSVHQGRVNAVNPTLSSPSHLLSAHMTHHRLTGARFSIPTSGEPRAIASLASAK